MAATEAVGVAGARSSRRPGRLGRNLLIMGLLLLLLVLAWQIAVRSMNPPPGPEALAPDAIAIAASARICCLVCS